MEFTNFKDLKVYKPDPEKIKKQYEEITNRITNAQTPDEATNAILDSFRLQDEISTNFDIIYIRQTINTLDEEYSKLNDYCDEIMPVIQEYSSAVDKAILNSRFLEEIGEKFGKHYIDLLKVSDKTFKPEIIDYLINENKLQSQYRKVVSSAQIEYKGKTYTLAQLGSLMQSQDREVRKETNELYWNFYAEHDKEIGDIYDKLVKVRTTIAQKLGYDNFIQLGYDRLLRIGYNYEDVKNYRDEVYINIVPLSNELFERKIKRIGITDPHYYDYSLTFKSGNPVPKGNCEELVEAASHMYSKMNHIASEKFEFMRSHGLFDLESKKGKAPGGYEAYVPGIKAPFIFSNFNGTSGDIDVLTHEFGHALQAFLGSSYVVPSYRSPGYECCEMHSMSMEFFAYPYISLLVGEEQDEKYRYNHLVSAINFIPYGVSVDEFQHFVYANPEVTHEQRKAEWRKIEKKYLPHRKYEDNAFLESGGYWLRQTHIFDSPFYYIDYTIAQVVAFEFFIESLDNYKATFEKYLKFDRLGGAYPYKELLKEADIKDPMVTGTIASITPRLKDYLSKINDFKY